MSTTMHAREFPSGDATPTLAAHLHTVELPRGATVDGGRYRIEGVLGQGGFGITYLAEDTRLHRSVAIKELFPPGCVRVGDRIVPRAVDDLAQARFERCRARFVGEAENLARFAHVGIVRIYELVEERGTAYVVMERLCGRTLNRLAVERGGRLPVDEALRIVEHMAAALTVVHQGGLLHRDVKPDNVVVTDDGRIVLVDFGAARQFVPDASSTMTQVLTPRYAPLEQYSTHASFGPATDVYGLAATCYRLIAGDAPPAAVDRLRGTPLANLADLDRRVPPAVSSAVAHGLALEPAERPQTAAAFLAALRAEPPGTAVTPALDFTWAASAWAQARRFERELAASLSSATARLPRPTWPAWPGRPAWARRRPPTPVRAWLPVVVTLAALASVAPLHAAGAAVLIVLPGANALVRTQRRYRIMVAGRGRRWHDPVTRPAVFAAEAARAVRAVAAEALTPLLVTAGAAVGAYIALGLADGGRRPMPIVRLLAAAAVVGLVVAVVRRLQHNPRFSPSFGADLLAPLVAPGGRLSVAGRVAWAAAVGVSAWVVLLPPWTLR